MGITGQLTEHALAFAKGGQGNFTFVSGEKEQFPGLHQRMKEAEVSSVAIRGMDDHADFGRLAREFAQVISTTRPDYVTVQTNWQLAVTVAARFLSGIRFKILYVVHGYRHNFRFRSVVARAVMGVALHLFADHVITPSSFLKEKFRFLGEKIKVIFIGEDEALFADHPLPEFGGTKRLVFPAEFRTGKNQEMVIRALKGYIDRTGDQDVELYLPGKGELVASCQELCRTLGLQDKVHFPGFVTRPEVAELYLSSQFALVASNVETFGHCVVEPFILGRVLLTRHVGVADDIIREGENGFFFDNEQDLMELLVKVLPDHALCRRVAANTRLERDRFRWDPICRQHFELIFT